MEEKIENLKTQLNYLQQRVIHLEKLENPKYALSATLEAPDATKIIQQGDSNLKDKKGAYLTQNNSEVRGMESKSPLKTAERSEEYNIPSDQDKGLNGANFTTLAKIPEDEKVEIIQTGFQRQAEGIISLKKYYESTDPYSLFQSKGYSMKYEAIRKNNLYKQLKK